MVVYQCCYWCFGWNVGVWDQLQVVQGFGVVGLDVVVLQLQMSLGQGIVCLVQVQVVFVGCVVLCGQFVDLCLGCGDLGMGGLGLGVDLFVYLL